MKRKTKIQAVTAAGATAAAALLLFGGITAANSTQYAEPGLEQGIEALEVNPDTNEPVVTDQFDNVAKDVGEEAGLVDEKTNRSLFNISVNNIDVTSTCPSRVEGMDFSPERGTFLVLDIEASVSTAMEDAVVNADPAADAELVFMPLIAEAFSVAGKDGSIDRNVGSQAAWSCFTDEELVPAVVNPGESVKGKLVLDVEHTSGKVVYDPENNGGWSWKY